MALVAAALHCGGGLVDAAPGAIDFTPELIEDSRRTRTEDGSITLRWLLPAESRVELEQDSTPTFAAPVSRYTGAEPGSVLTGLPEGEHFFRIRAVATTGRPGPWSKPLEVKVAFMERGQLTLLLALGGLVVILTVGAILSGHLRTRSND